jgi:hypothetical protein
MKNFTYQELSKKLDAKNYELYLSTKSLLHDSNDILQEIFLCHKGEDKGCVVDVFYNFKTDEIIGVQKSKQ